MTEGLPVEMEPAVDHVLVAETRAVPGTETEATPVADEVVIASDANISPLWRETEPDATNLSEGDSAPYDALPPKALSEPRALRNNDFSSTLPIKDAPPLGIGPY